MLNVRRDQFNVIAILEDLIVVKKVDEQFDVKLHPCCIRQIGQLETPVGGKAVQVMLCTGLPLRNPGASSQSGEEISVLKIGMVDTNTWCGNKLVLLQLLMSCTTKVTMYSPGVG